VNVGLRGHRIDRLFSQFDQAYWARRTSHRRIAPHKRLQMCVGRLYEHGPLKDSCEIARMVGAMISSEVQRTLVKSPPELWAEISDPESLARHLGKFGEIRITRVQPEQKVEWEADDASGTVVIKPSGWGTKVKLTVTRELAQPEAADESPVEADDQLDDEQPSAHAPEQVAGEPAQDDKLEPDAADTTALADEPVDVTGLDAELESDADIAPIIAATPELESASERSSPAEPQAEAEPQTEAETHAEAGTTSEEPSPQPEPEPRRGFFARLFGRRRAHAEGSSAVELVEPAPEPIAGEPIEDDPLSAGVDGPECDFVDGPVHEHEPEPALSVPADEPTATGAQPLGEIAAETGTPAVEQTIDGPEDSTDSSEQEAVPDDASTRAQLAEELAAEEVTAVLTGVLDRLGAAHHRPFSRA
jgi:hypothetical protein